MRVAAAPRTLVVGHGQLGAALARALGARAPGAVVVWTRRPLPARDRAQGAQYVQGALPSAAWRADARSTGDEVVFLAVPDGAVAGAAAAAAATRSSWDGVAAFHAAGALGVEPLEPLVELGAAAAVLHPLRAFPRAGDVSDPRSLFEGAPFTLDGDERAVEVGRRLVAALGGTLLASRVSDRAAYHLAAALASNYGRLVLEWSVRRFESAGLSTTDSRSAAASLLVNAVAAGTASVPAAFTGPIRRGDVATVETHLAALRGVELAAYATLGLLLLEELEGSGGGREPGGGAPRDVLAATLRTALLRATDEIAGLAVAAPARPA